MKNNVYFSFRSVKPLDILITRRSFVCWVETTKPSTFAPFELFFCLEMSLFTRTASQVDQLEQQVKELKLLSDSPVAARKEAADTVNASLNELRPSINKFVTKAEERDPNKRIYGSSMVAKIFALRDRFVAIFEEFTLQYESLNKEWKSYKEQQRAEEECKRAEEEKLRAQEQRVEAERIERERRELEEHLLAQKKKEEDERREKEELARQEEEKREAEQRVKEERAAAEKRRQEEEQATVLAKRSEEENTANFSTNKSNEQASNSDSAKESETISVNIKTTRGVTHSLLGVSPTATVAELKETIEREHNVNKAAQRLIFQGRLLVDANTIDTYKIAEGSAIHLVENPRAAAASASTSSSTTVEKLTVPPGTVCQLQNGKRQFDEIVAECGAQRLVVVDWFAPWCGPCRMISPVFERLASRFSDVTFIKVDTEASPANAQLAAENQITAYPTFHFILNRSVKHSFSGSNATAIEASIKKYRVMVTSKSSGTQNSSTAGSSSGALGPIATRVMASLTTLHRNLPMSDFVVAVRTLLKFVRNIVENPGMEKYRKVRTANSTYQSRLGSKQGGTNCMRAFGFKDVLENGENFLVISAETAEDPELRTVMSQLESALESATANSSTAPQGSGEANAAAPTGPNPTDFRALAGGLAGMLGGDGGGVPGGVGPMRGAGSADAMADLIQDPSFQQIARDVMTDPEALTVLMEAQQAFTSGDMATVQRLQAHPAMLRLQAAMTSNPVFLNLMMREMANRGFPGMGGAGMGGTGMGGAGGVDGMGGGVTGAREGGQGTGAQQTAAGNGAPDTPAPVGYPGAPTTAEEEEQLLQEAIRLSMQDQTQSKPEERREDGDDSQDKQT